MKKNHPLQRPGIEPWTPTQLRLHKEAVRRLETILSLAVARVSLKKNITEEQLYKFIVDRMMRSSIASMSGWAIVAYGPSAAEPHYEFPRGKSRKIKPGHFLLIDIWGKLNRPDAPYADITHMYFVGKNPSSYFQTLWNDLRDARDCALALIQKNSHARGDALHGCASDHLDHCNYKGLFIHGLGHDLGHDHVHGPGANLSPKFSRALIAGRGYTIEPGIYKKGKFGVRSEMDFFFDANRRVQVTTRLQNQLECISA
ncbi:MAG: M24 family metallopeptidase [bacterium]|nr:M24 family metallopeptidase [bacterium]